ncbi:hypothetical protein GCM10010503_27090 [Streptomyces lucensis JCM 4490]|uniref:Uncharacterized protein n=1 Tax=Streptomyces lucensis JCM 4490 TaxID=1306176 RepID=A0A918J538_9ACTN|nr:hypothetical protein GCM10010503_27090 [Streptomyces lucensis JCM 4490]
MRLFLPGGLRRLRRVRRLLRLRLLLSLRRVLRGLERSRTRRSSATSHAAELRRVLAPSPDRASQPRRANKHLQAAQLVREGCVLPGGARSFTRFRVKGYPEGRLPDIPGARVAAGSAC